MAKAATRVVDAPLAPPAGNSGLLEVFRRRYLLRLLVRRELSARYQGSFLGLFWSYVQPAIRLALYWFVIGKIIGLGIENFAVHVFSALVLVHYFTETFGSGTRSIMANKGLVKKMAVPREMFPVASMLVSAYHVVPGMVLLTGICVAMGWQPDLAGLGAGLLGFAIVAVLGTALALVFSAANVYFRDFGNIVQSLNQIVTFSVPMIYGYSTIADRFGKGGLGWVVDLYLLNPVAEAVLLFQRCFWTGTTKNPSKTIREDMPDHLFLLGFAHLGFALVVLVLAQVLFSKMEKKIPERL